MATKKTTKRTIRRQNGRGPERVEILEPSSRTLVRWNPSLIESAELAAQAGNLRLAADLVEEMLADDRVKGILKDLCFGLLGLPLKFEPGLGRKKHRAVKALEAEEDWFSMFPEEQLVQLISWGMVLGVGLGQNHWTDRDTGRVIPRLQKFRERWLRYDWFTRSWRLYVGVGDNAIAADEMQIAPGDGRFVLFMPGGANQPWLQGAWRGIARWWLLKQYARDDFARHGEVHGSPWRVAVNPEGDSKYDRRKIAADLQQMGRDGSLSLPAGWDVKLVEATARTWEMFVAQNKLANDGITIALASQNLTTEVSGGSLAAAEVHFEVRSDIRRGIDEALGTCLHEQSLEQWAEINFGDRHLAPWVTHDTDPTEDTKKTAETWKLAGDAIAALEKAGVPVDKAAAAERIGVPVLKGVQPAPSATEPEPDSKDPQEPDEDEPDENESEPATP